VSDSTDKPSSELNRKKNLKAPVCGEKLPPPTMETLLPPTYMAVRKSVGVGPLLARTAVPSTGWMTSAVPSVSPRAHVTTSTPTMTGPQKDMATRRCLPRGRDAQRKSRQTICEIRGARIPVPSRA
jgi:hypothetical protein